MSGKPMMQGMQDLNARGRLMRLRASAKSLSDTIAEKQLGCCRLAEGWGAELSGGLGWEHSLVLEYQQDIAFWQQRREMVLREIIKAEADVAAEEQERKRPRGQELTLAAIRRMGGPKRRENIARAETEQALKEGRTFVEDTLRHRPISKSA